MGWAEGRWTHQNIDLNHNFADLNTPLWEAEDDGLVPNTVPNHHLPMPAYYVLPNATVSIQEWGPVDGHPWHPQFWLLPLLTCICPGGP